MAHRIGFLMICDFCDEQTDGYVEGALSEVREETGFGVRNGKDACEECLVPVKRRGGAKTCRCGERIVPDGDAWRHTSQTRSAYADPYHCVTGLTARPADAG
jgi:hypothetical protein